MALLPLVFALIFPFFHFLLCFSNDFLFFQHFIKARHLNGLRTNFHFLWRTLLFNYTLLFNNFLRLLRSRFCTLF
eukprot:UN08041